jgi:hypothetical protein
MPQGSNNNEIAATLNISVKTVRNHLSTIFSELGASTRAQVIVQARDAGFGRRRRDPLRVILCRISPSAICPFLTRTLRSRRIAESLHSVTRACFTATIRKCLHLPHLSGQNANHGSNVTIAAVRIKQTAKKYSCQIREMAQLCGIS